MGLISSNGKPVAAKQQINRETHRDIWIPIELLASSSLRAHLIIAAI